MSKIYFLFVFILLSVAGIMAQSNTRDIVLANATADSSSIAVNKRAGWQFYGSSLTLVKTDSVMIEMIVQHDRIMDWSQEQLVGRIKSVNLIPQTGQTLLFKLIDNQYQLRVESNGLCYLRLVNGVLPEGDPVIVPVRVVYKL